MNTEVIILRDTRVQYFMDIQKWKKRCHARFGVEYGRGKMSAFFSQKLWDTPGIQIWGWSVGHLERRGSWGEPASCCWRQERGIPQVWGHSPSVGDLEPPLKLLQREQSLLVELYAFGQENFQQLGINSHFAIALSCQPGCGASWASVQLTDTFGQLEFQTWIQEQSEVAPVSSWLICARKALLFFNAPSFYLLIRHHSALGGCLSDNCWIQVWKLEL